MSDLTDRLRGWNRGYERLTAEREQLILDLDEARTLVAREKETR